MNDTNTIPLSAAKLKERERELKKLINVDLAKTYIKAMRPTTWALEEYHFVTILQVVSSIIRRKAYVWWGTSQIYTNLYSLVVAPSSMAKKSTAVDEYKKWIEKLNLQKYLIGGIATLEGLADALYGSEPDDPDEKIEGVGFAHEDEFSSLLAILARASYANGLLDKLTGLYGCGYLAKTTRNKPIYIPKTYLNIIGATTLDSLSRYLNEFALLSGFFPRFLVCYVNHMNEYQERERPDNELMGMVESRLLRMKEFIDDMGTNNAKEYKLEENAESFRKTWSKKTFDFAKTQSTNIQTMIGRADTLFFKIALILHFMDGKYEEKYISHEIARKAVAIVNWNTRNYKNLIEGNAKKNIQALAFDDNKRRQNKLLDLISKKKVLRRSNIKQQTAWNYIVIDEIMDGFSGEGIVRKDIGKLQGIIYTYIEPEDRVEDEIIEEPNQDSVRVV